MTKLTGDSIESAATHKDNDSLDSGNAQPKTTKGAKARRHCGRFWWAYLLAFCAIVLIVVLCVIYVAVPRIAQNGVNDSSIQLTGISILNPTPTSFDFSQDAVLNNPSSYQPTLDAFNGSLYLVSNGTVVSTPLLHIPVPAIHATDNSDVTIDPTTLNIANLDQMSQFCLATLQQQTVTSRLIGTTDLHLGGLPSYSVDFNKDISYTGLNGLAGFNLTNTSVNILAAAGQPNLRATAILQNPSPLTFAMGNVTMNIVSSATMLGSVTLYDMTLMPGSNSFQLNGTVNTLAVALSANSSGFANVNIIGNSSIYDGLHLPYYEYALQRTNLSYSFNVGQILAGSTSL